MYDGLQRRRSASVSHTTWTRMRLMLNGSNSAVVGMPSSDVPRSGRGPKQPDTRRNLYVLGLPFDLTKYVFAICGRTQTLI